MYRITIFSLILLLVVLYTNHQENIKMVSSWKGLNSTKPFTVNEYVYTKVNDIHTNITMAMKSFSVVPRNQLVCKFSFSFVLPCNWMAFCHKRALLSLKTSHVIEYIFFPDLLWYSNYFFPTVLSILSINSNVNIIFTF